MCDLQYIKEREGKAKKEVALDMGVLLLTQVIRMTPPVNLHNMEAQFLNVMIDIAENENWYALDVDGRHLGGKLMKLLASASYTNLDACIMFVKFTRGLTGLHWQWQFSCILLLGALVCGSSSPNIRRLAMEEGLIKFLEWGHDSVNLAEPGNKEGKEDTSWIVRSAAVVALSEVYQQFKTNNHGLLAREVMQRLYESEQHSTVKSLLSQSKAKTPKETFVSRVSFLFRHTSIAFAETYAEIENEYHYMKSYMKHAEGNSSRFKARRAIQNQNKQRVKSTVNTSHSRRETPDPNELSTRVSAQPPQFSNLESFSFSDSDYHSNYKKLGFEHDSYFNLELGIKNAAQGKLPPLAPSFVSTSAGITKAPKKPAGLGSHTRRKLFDNHGNGIRDESPGWSEAMENRKPAAGSIAIKLPIAPPLE